jgi:hypothetical protein
MKINFEILIMHGLHFLFVNRYNEIQKQLSVEWRQMSAASKQVWIDKASDVKRQLDEYNTERVSQGLAVTKGKKGGDMRRVKKGIALPKGPRLVVARVVWCVVMWCGVVWCGVVWYGVVWCGVWWCGVL